MITLPSLTPFRVTYLLRPPSYDYMLKEFVDVDPDELPNELLPLRNIQHAMT